MHLPIHEWLSFMVSFLGKYTSPMEPKGLNKKKTSLTWNDVIFDGSKSLGIDSLQNKHS